MKRYISFAFLLAFIVTVGLLASRLLPLQPKSAAQQQVLTAGGSSSVEDFALTLLEAYMYTLPEASGGATYTPGSSSEGVTGVRLGNLDVAFTSHLPHEPGIQVFPLAMADICFITHPTNPVESLSPQELYSIFSGEITDWAQLGGTPGEILLLGMQPGNGTRESLYSIWGTTDTPYAVVFEGEGALLQEVARQENAFGYCISWLADTSVTILEINGQAPGDTGYPYKQDVCLVTAQQPSPSAQAFLNLIPWANIEGIVTAMLP